MGLKPGRGLVPAGESTGGSAGLVVAGPLARSAADAALLLDALVPPPPSGTSRRAGRLPAAWPPRTRPRCGSASAWTARGRRPSRSPRTREALDALEAGIRLLEAAGHETGEAAIRYDNRYPGAFTTAWTAGVGSARIAPQREALLTPLTRTFRRRAQQRSAAKLNESLEFLRQFQRDTLAQYAAWDLILSPALAQTPRPVGWFTGAVHGDGYWPAAEWAGDADDDYRKQCEFAPWSSMVNVCGLPADQHSRALDRRVTRCRPADGHPAGRPDGFRGAAAASGHAARILGDLPQGFPGPAPAGVYWCQRGTRQETDQ